MNETAEAQHTRVAPARSTALTVTGSSFFSDTSAISPKCSLCNNAMCNSQQNADNRPHTPGDALRVALPAWQMQRLSSQPLHQRSRTHLALFGRGCDADGAFHCTAIDKSARLRKAHSMRVTNDVEAEKGLALLHDGLADFVGLNSHG